MNGAHVFGMIVLSVPMTFSAWMVFRGCVANVLRTINVAGVFLAASSFGLIGVSGAVSVAGDLAGRLFETQSGSALLGFAMVVLASRSLTLARKSPLSSLPPHGTAIGNGVFAGIGRLGIAHMTRWIA